MTDEQGLAVERNLRAAIAELKCLAEDRMDELRSCKAESARLSAQVERIKEAEALVTQQAEDESLWFSAQYITEATLQEALRQLHAAIEGKSPDECARSALSNGGEGNGN